MPSSSFLAVNGSVYTQVAFAFVPMLPLQYVRLSSSLHLISRIPVCYFPRRQMFRTQRGVQQQKIIFLGEEGFSTREKRIAGVAALPPAETFLFRERRLQ